LADTLASIVDLIHPTSSGIGVITTDQVWVLFDREIDETTIAGGNFFVAGPDFDIYSGPDLQLYHDVISTEDENEILESPGFGGIVQGDITFQRISLSDSTLVVSGIDIIGSGILYRTKAIFTPTNRLAANTEYRVYLTGDEDSTGSLTTGLSDRTVFDTITSGINTGTGSAEFTGGYNGLAVSDFFHIQITTPGDVGTSKFEYWRTSDPLTTFGPFKTRYTDILLGNGVYVSFEDGTYDTGDSWLVKVKGRSIFGGNLTWPFQTGTGSIVDIPETAATSIIGDTIIPAVTAATSTTTLNVLETDPEDGESHLPLPSSTYTITATFNQTLNPSTVTSGVSVSVYAESVNGETSITANGDLVALPSASGAVLSILVASGQLLNNNLVTVTLDKTIASTGGISLGTDYSWSFTTEYTPYYCTLRRIRLDAGAFLSSVPDDTINLAIFEASRQADEMTWNKGYDDSAYYEFVRSMWTCCKSQEVLLINTTGGSNKLKSKQLGDLRVEYDTSGDISQPLSRALDCMAKWEMSLRAGGATVQKPSMVIKGEDDPDRPFTGRGWYMDTAVPAANVRVKLFGSRRYKKTYSGRYGS
jgi:hypothetical protein